MRSLMMGIAGLAFAAFVPGQAAAVAQFSTGASLIFNVTSATGSTFEVTVDSPSGIAGGVNGATTPLAFAGSPTVDVSFNSATSPVTVAAGQTPVQIAPFQIFYTGVGNPGDVYAGSAFLTATLTVRNVGTTAGSLTMQQTFGGGISASTTEAGETAAAGILDLRRFNQQMVPAPFPGGTGMSLTPASIVTSPGDLNGFFSGAAPVLTHSYNPGQSRSWVYQVQLYGTLSSPAQEETVVPVPAALPLMGAALLGLGLVARRRRKDA